MVFSSHVFVFYFLPVALGAYYLGPRQGRHLTLTLLSYVFYGWSSPIFVLLMLGSTAVDFACGLTIGKVDQRLDQDGERTRSQRLALAASVLTNLSLLGFFKYANFGIDSYNHLMSSLGLDAARWETALRITLPLGISFYTFQSMSYTIDVYQGRARASRNFIDFACYVAMFPQLVAGPIVRFHEIAEQFRNRGHTLEKFARGAAFFCLGMAKKIVLANPCGKIADLCFGAASVSILDAWYGVVAYAFQIYFDFSGYSDMAVGLGLMFAFSLPRNFDYPYRSASITELWQRWHRSLSRWLRDYLYIPLGGNRRGARRTYANLGIVMLLGGLWHGASLNFLVWGAYHGVLLMLERALGRYGLARYIPYPIRVVVTFILMLFSWVLFRAPDLPSAIGYLGHLFGVGEVQVSSGLIAGVIYQPYYLTSFLIAGWIVWGCRDTWEFIDQPARGKSVLCLLLLVIALALMTAQDYNPFIYFIF